MAYSNQYHPYPGPNPTSQPPVFAAELEAITVGSRPPPGSQPGPDGGFVFEMSAESAAPNKSKEDEEGATPARQSPAQTGAANPWPFYLDVSEGNKKEDHRNATSPPAQAQPWAYHGPETQGREERQQSVKSDGNHGHTYSAYSPNSARYDDTAGHDAPPQVPRATRPPASAPSSPDPRDQSFSPYPAPLNLVHRPAKSPSPSHQAFKPYSPPGCQNDSAVPAPLAGVGRTHSQSTTHSAVNSVSYQPYRPQSSSEEHASAAAPASTATTGAVNVEVVSNTPSGGHVRPYSPGVATHQFYTPPTHPPTSSPAPSAGSRPGSRPPTVPPATPLTAPPAATSPFPAAGPAVTAAGGAAAGAVIPAASTPTPPVAVSSQTPPVQTLSPQVQNTVPCATPAQQSAAATIPPQPAATPVSTHPGPVPSPYNMTPAPDNAVPFPQPQYAAPVAGPNYGNVPVSVPPMSSPPPTVPGAGGSSYQTAYPPVDSGYNIPQPTYAPASPPPAPISSPLPQQQTGPHVVQQPVPSCQGAPGTTAPQSASTATPTSPPPPYTEAAPLRPGSQLPPTGQASFQPPTSPASVPPGHPSPGAPPYQSPQPGQTLPSAQASSPGQAPVSGQYPPPPPGPAPQGQYVQSQATPGQVGSNQYSPIGHPQQPIYAPTGQNTQLGHPQQPVYPPQGQTPSPGQYPSGQAPPPGHYPATQIPTQAAYSQYPTQPTYATPDASHQGQVPGHASYNPSAPPLPPRPLTATGQPQVSYTPGSFGAPLGYNPANYPPPPKTHYDPPPPPLPGRPSTGRLFTSANAKKWIDKTNQVFENKLAPMWQGSADAKYKPTTGQQHHATPPAQYQAQFQPSYQTPQYQSPHLAPQYQGASGIGAPQGTQGQHQGCTGQQRWG